MVDAKNDSLKREAREESLDVNDKRKKLHRHAVSTRRERLALQSELDAALARSSVPLQEKI